MPLGNVVGPYDQPGGMYAVSNALESGALKNAAQSTANQFQAPLLKDQLAVKDFFAQNPMFNVKDENILDQAGIDYYNANNNPAAANAIAQARAIKQYALGANAGYHQLLGQTLPQRVQTQQGNALLSFINSPQGQRMAVDNPALYNNVRNYLGTMQAKFSNQNQLKNNAIAQGNISVAPNINGLNSGNLMPQVNAAPAQSSVQNNAFLTPNPSTATPQDYTNQGSNADTSSIPGSSKTTASVPVLTPEQALKSSNPDVLDDETFNLRKQSALGILQKHGEAGQRALNSVTSENFLNSPAYQNAINTILKFRGEYGSGWLKQIQGFGENSPEYQQYITSVKTLKTLLAGSAIRLAGFHATNNAIKHGMSIFQTLSNPFNQSIDQGVADLKQGRDLMDAEARANLGTFGLKLNDFIRSDTVPVISPNGQTGRIPRSQLQYAISKKGYKINTQAQNNG